MGEAFRQRLACALHDAAMDLAVQDQRIDRLAAIVDRRIALERDRPARFCGRGGWFVAAKWWTFVMLLVSIVISVPSWNSVIHGTQAVVAHAMGTTIGIDTLVLLGTASWLIGEAGGAAALGKLDSSLQRLCIRWISWVLAVLVGWLMLAGATHGWHRYLGESTPDWVIRSRFVLPVVGGLLGGGLLLVAIRFLRLLRAG